MSTARVAQESGGWTVGNARYRLVIEPGTDGMPSFTSLCLGDTTAPAENAIIAPRLRIRSSPVELRFERGEVRESVRTFGRGIEEIEAPALVLTYSCTGDEVELEVEHCVCPSAHHPVWRSWTTVRNVGSAPLGGLSLFDAAAYRFPAGSAQPEVGYVLGWLDGPRLEAPGRPPTPHRYPSWIPRLLYGDAAPEPPPPPEGGWMTAPMRFVREKLSSLPLRSGMRSTYDNLPWAIVRCEDGIGFFLGLEWSGMWAADLRYHRDSRDISVNAGSDGNEHDLDPGQTITSPAVFTGLFAGDWDDGSNACRSYVRTEILPPRPAGFPDAHYGTMPVDRAALKDRHAWEAEVDAAAAAGLDSFLVDAGWWIEGMEVGGDFSTGLGSFEDDARKFPFPGGLLGLSDYVHGKGMKFGLWFEFERVDLRIANRGARPWNPEWMVHHGGYPYRSWLKDVFVLCLGERRAAEWARDSLIEALRRYRVDWLKIDGNEYAVCDDDTHSHAKRDGDWHQTIGLFTVMDGIARSMPDLYIENCAGGSQRADFAMARRSHVLQTNDIMIPSSIVRQYSHGVGCMYPTSYGMMFLPIYPQTGVEIPEGPITDNPFRGVTVDDGVGCSPERLEWRCLCRMMGTFFPGVEFWKMGAEHRNVVRRAVATYKRLLPSLDGDRYVLTDPPQLVAPLSEEIDRWEVYEHLSPDERLVSVFFYRCESADGEFSVRLKGLRPECEYRGTSHTGGHDGVWTGAELMEVGLVCRLPRTRCAEVVVLERVE